MDVTISEDLLKSLIRSAGRVVHINECARMQWKAGNDSAALIYFDRSDAELGRAFKKVQEAHPEVIEAVLDAARDANEGK